MLAQLESSPTAPRRIVCLVRMDIFQKPMKQPAPHALQASTKQPLTPAHPAQLGALRLAQTPLATSAPKAHTQIPKQRHVNRVHLGIFRLQTRLAAPPAPLGNTKLALTLVQHVLAAVFRHLEA